eukprot:5955958-Amphidinium_carterae.1
MGPYSMESAADVQTRLGKLGVAAVLAQCPTSAFERIARLVLVLFPLVGSNWSRHFFLGSLQ